MCKLYAHVRTRPHSRPPPCSQDKPFLRSSTGASAFAPSRHACALGSSNAGGGVQTAGQLVLSCPDCVIAASGSLAVTLSVALHWSCQTILLRA